MLALALVAATAATWASSALAAGPTLTGRVGIVGNVRQGQKLTASPGTWTSVATGAGAVTTTYQWYRCDAAGARCSSIHGAKAAGYTLVAGDVGKTIALNVAATDPSGTTTAYASVVGPVVAKATLLSSTVQPAVTGPSVQGQTLTVGNGTWSSTPAAYAYSWYRCNANGRACSVVDGATAATYASAAADVGHALVASVRATYGTTTSSAFSTASAAIVVPTGPVNSVAPVVSGVAKQGQRLVASTGTWTGTGTIAYSYQWYRCNPTGAQCSSIHGATGAGYTLGPKDAGQTLGLTVKAKDTIATASAYASLVGPIAPPGAALTSSVRPAFAGTVAVGQTLTVANGVWNVPPATFTYAWYRCNPNGRVCVAIPGATAATYAIAADDAKHALVVLVQASTRTATQAVLSVATAPVP